MGEVRQMIAPVVDGADAIGLVEEARREKRGYERGAFAGPAHGVLVGVRKGRWRAGHAPTSDGADAR